MIPSSVLEMMQVLNPASFKRARASGTSGYGGMAEIDDVSSSTSVSSQGKPRSAMACCNALPATVQKLRCGPSASNLCS